jgi:pimeloyl-ACP methyl ester carboxylesterase
MTKHSRLAVGLLALALATPGCSKSAAEPGATHAPAAALAPTGKSPVVADVVAWAPGFQHETVTANGQQIHFVVGGRGSPLLLIHGWPETAFEWRKMLPELAASHRVYAVDLRGAGGSSVPKAGYDKKTLASDVYSALLELGVSKAVVVGHDWGASVAYAYAAQFPSAVDRLVVCEGVPFGPWLPKTDIFWYFTFMRIPGFAERVTAGNERAYLDWFYRTSEFHRVANAIDDSAVTQYLETYSQPARMKAGFELYRSIDRDVADNTELSKTKLTMPVLAVAGENGAGDAVAKSMSAVALDVSSVLLADTGHFIPEERPAAFASLIAQFLAGKLQKEQHWAPDMPSGAPVGGRPLPPMERVGKPPERSLVVLPAGFGHRNIEANGQRLHLVVGGKGSPVVLIHGWPESWYEWRKVMPLLAAHHTVIVPDLRGFGDSSRPDSGYDKKTLAEDVFQAVTSLGFEKVALVGHDWGAPVAYAYAAQHRAAVTSLTAIEGDPKGPWTKDKAPFWFFGFQRIPNYAERVLQGHEAEYLRWFYENPHLTHGAIDADAIAEYTRSHAAAGGIRAGSELYRSIDTDVADNTDFAKVPLAIPVLAIGAEDGNGKAVAESMKHVASRVTELYLDKTGHFVPEEKPELLVEKLATFLR